MTARRRLWAIFFPERCVCCGKVIPPAADLCEDCRQDMPYVGIPVCPFCGVEKEWCRCRKRRRHFERVVAPFYYRNQVEHGILHMKKTGIKQSVHFFAAHTAETVRQYYGDVTFDVVLYVPSTRKDENARGFNPAKLLAEQVAAELQLPLVTALAKIAQIPPQKSLFGARRRGNVLGAFDVLAEYDVAGKTLLLVDDVVTTGSTLDECAKMLKIYGAEQVYAATAAVKRYE